MTFENIQTERLILEKLGPEEYRLLFDSGTDEDLMRLLHFADAGELAKEKEKHRKGMTSHNRSFLYFQLIEKASGKKIGGCGFHNWFPDHSRSEIGYALKEEELKAKGFMSEAMEAIIAYGFAQMKLNRIEAFVGTNNVPSLKLVNKFGFVKEGHLRKHYCNNGVIEDSLVFGLLKEEWEKKNDKHD